MTTETGTDPLTFDAAGVGCKKVWVIRRQTALLGVQVWSIELDVRWCFAFGVVRTIERSKVVSCCSGPWYFDQWIAEDYQPAGGYSAQSRLQAQFKYSIVWFQGGKTPWISITVYADGTYAWAWG